MYQKGVPDSKLAYNLEITARSLLCSIDGVSESEKQVHLDNIERAKGVANFLADD